jgi:threonine/homoserine efflux transporter RhtA
VPGLPRRSFSFLLSLLSVLAAVGGVWLTYVIRAWQSEKAIAVPEE